MTERVSRGRGRPKLPKTKKMGQIVKVQLQPEQHRQIRQAAKALHKSMSAYLREKGLAS